MLTNLLNTSSIVSLETAVYSAGNSFNLTKLLSVELFGLGAHARNREDLLILLYTLM